MNGIVLTRRQLWALMFLLMSSRGALADPPRLLARQPESVRDVSLTKESMLEGYLIDPFGKVLKDSPVTIVQNRKVVWTGRTNAEGHFQVQGLSSGVYFVDSDRSSTCCRVWSKESAPPRASRSLLLTRDSGPDKQDSHQDEFNIRISGFSTLTLPRMTTRDIRKLISP